MRATDLLGAAVYDNSGRKVGNVRDLRVEAGGPGAPGSGEPAYRLTEIEFGPVGIAHRLGYGHRSIKGPWLFERMLARLAQRSLVARWDQLERVGEGRIDLSVPESQLRRLGEQGDD
jgi:PRC-barrel domain